MKYLIPIFSAITILVIPFVVWAQCTSLPAGSAQRSICQVIADIATFLRIAGIALAVVIVVWSGIKYMTAGADEQKVASAKKTLLYGLIGAAIVMAAYFIILLLREFLEDYGFSYNLIFRV